MHGASINSSPLTSGSRDGNGQPEALTNTIPWRRLGGREFGAYWQQAAERFTWLQSLDQALRIITITISISRVLHLIP